MTPGFVTVVAAVAVLTWFGLLMLPILFPCAGLP
jgi:hypothetical protein